MKTIKLNNGGETMVDDDIYEKYHSYAWRKFKSVRGNSFYARRAIWNKKKNNMKSSYLHREILNVPKGMYIDHINGDGLDNRRENLRLCNCSENRSNCEKSIRNTSGYKGVGRSGKKWIARITKNYEYYHLGTYSDIKAAVSAYNEAAKKYHGEFAKLNKV